jgi:hypothetical protein
VKVHQELRIGPLTEEQQTEFISSIEEHLSGGWHRDSNEEIKLLTSVPGNKFYCFTCAQKGNRQAAKLLLTHPARIGTSWLYASNIIPQKIRELTIDQYNYILSEFHNRFAKPTADSIGIALELSSPEQTVENWLSPESAKLLRRFSSAANKSTGSGHPMDRQRWCDFLIGIHRAGENPDSGLLERWLTEEEKWPDDTAFELVCEYEFAQDLLKRFDT